jgi:translation elongation factor EF-4
MCEKLKELIPRQQFDIPFKPQLVKVISRETIKALRKDVTKMLRWWYFRKRKLLKNRKETHETSWNVEIPQEAFMAVLKLND